MKAVIVEQYGSSSALKYAEEYPEPGPLLAGHVLVRNAFAGINYIDVYQRSGVYPVDLPAILGREGAGEVISVAADVTDFNVGDRVAYLSANSYAELVNVNSTYCIRLPEDISFETGASIMLQGMTAVYLTHRSYAVRKGDFVLVTAAAGGTGGIITQICSMLGAHVIGLVSTAAKAETFKSYGGHEAINYTTEDVPKRVSEITGGQGVQVVYDSVSGDTFDMFIACLARFGYFISFGNAGGKVNAIDPFKLSPKCIYYTRPTLFGHIATRDEFLFRKHLSSL